MISFSQQLLKIKLLSTSTQGSLMYEAEDNVADVIRDIKYCPFCDRNGNIATIHPKPDEQHPLSN